MAISEPDIPWHLVFGGTFDPVHLGHLRVAVEVAEQLSARVALMPCYQPVHGKMPGASPAQRLAMLGLALERHNPDRCGPGQFLTVSRMEIDRGGPSYMVDTAAALNQCNPACVPGLLMGVDAFLSLDRWKDWQEIVRQTNLVVFHRPGWVMDEQAPILHRLKAQKVRFWSDPGALSPSLFSSAVGGHVVFVETTRIGISSTQIRNLIRQGRSVDYLLPEAVHRYIVQNGLYATLKCKRKT